MPARNRLDARSSLAIQQATLRLLGRQRAVNCILYIDERVLEGGTLLGPRVSGARVRSARATLVFVDEQPLQNFAHACRYWLFDPQSAKLIEQHEARFPPYPQGWPPTYRRFGPRPVPRPPVEAGSAPVLPVRPPARPQPLASGGRRLAVFFAGSPDPSSLNTMEFGYRILLQRGFVRSRIRVASYKGAAIPTCAKWEGDGTQPKWAVGGQPFEMKVTHPGDAAGFRAALAELAPQSRDLLFIHTSGHGEGDYSWRSKGSYLETRHGDAYYARDFRADLQMHVGADALLVMMQQCCSGGFKSWVVRSGVAPRIAFASAAARDELSNNELDNDSNYAWNIFALNWFAAHNNGYQYAGDPLTAQADLDGNGLVAAKEAFQYARETPRAHPDDSPQHGYRSGAVQASQQIELLGN